MLQGLFRKNSLSMVEHQHFIEQIEGFICAECLVVGFEKLGPWFRWHPK